MMNGFTFDQVGKFMEITEFSEDLFNNRQAILKFLHVQCEGSDSFGVTRREKRR